MPSENEVWPINLKSRIAHAEVASGHCNEYTVAVTYAPLPSFAELESEFGEGRVSKIFDGRTFQKHASCENVAEIPGDKNFLVKSFERYIVSKSAIAEMDELGYRPATHLEAYAFAKVCPNEQFGFAIVALGSFAIGDNGRVAAAIDDSSYGGGERRFVDRWLGRKWSPGTQFLFVRK